MSPAEILRAAKARIADPARWCQGMFAQTASCFPVDARSGEACAWCAVGALRSVTTNELDFQVTRRLLERAAHQVLPGYDAPGVNDLSDHADVMLMFDKAIEFAEVN